VTAITDVSPDAGTGLAYEPSLDGLRGIAIAGVLVYHACAAAGMSGWFRGGFIGVSVFFTLSGYLITTLLLTERQRRGRIDLGRFVSRRVRRLSPALLVTVLAVVVLSAADVLAAHASDATAAVWSVTNWHVILSGESQLLRTIVGPLGPTWSLAVEEQLYVLLVLAVLASMRSRRPERTLLTVALVATAVSTVLAATVSRWNPRLEFGTDVRAAEVALGVALAVLLRSPRTPRLSRRRADVVAGTGLALIVSGFCWIDLTPPWILRGGYPLLAMVTAATLTGLLAHGRVASVLAGPGFVGRGLVGLGRISYSLYLVHWPVISVLTTARLGFDGAPHAIVTVAASVAAGVALHVAVEQPVRRMPPTGARVTLAAHVGAGLAVTAIALLLLP
jgi:peptidoglycan/LPS O-acetylase OafA/YrhL